MDPDVLSFAQVMAVIVMVVGSLTVIGIAIAFATKRLKRKENAISDADARLEQLQQSVDSIAIEVERISEAQRFSAQLLAQRAEPPALKH